MAMAARRGGPAMAARRGGPAMAVRTEGSHGRGSPVEQQSAGGRRRGGGASGGGRRCAQALSSKDIPIDLDLEIERTLRKQRKARELEFRIPENPPASSATASDIPSVSIPTPDFSTMAGNGNEHNRNGNNVNHGHLDGRTIRELAAPDVHYQSLCIQYPQLDATFELKSGLIHLLPKFHGLAGEDPHKHLKEFHVVCSTMRPQGVDEEQIKLRAFPFSLDGAAKDWLYYLPHAAITSWDGLKRIFLEKFFPASRTAAIRKEICGIRQNHGETLHEYWERFKKLCSSCPHHQISDQLLVQYFYEGLIPMDRYLVDAASGGALSEKTPAAAQELISKMAQNAQQFGTRSATPMRQANEIGVAAINDQQRIENKLEELASMVRQLALDKGQSKSQQVCGICSLSSHGTDQCPQLQENTEACAGIFPGRPFQPQHHQQQRYDPYAATYNPGWRDHPNLRYGGPSNQPFQPQQQQPQQHRFNAQRPSQSMQQPQPAPKSESSLEDIMKQLVANNLQFQQRTDTAIQNLETQIGQLATNISELRSQGSGQLPSQPVSNPRGNVSAIVLRSGKELSSPPSPQPELGQQQESQREDQPPPIQKDKQPTTIDQDRGETSYNHPLPFPHRATQNKKRAEAELDKEIMETFKKVEVNIPLLEAIRQIPKYAKFLKDLCTHKRKLKGNEKINLGRNVSALIQPAMPQKCKDPGTFTIPCTIGNLQFYNAMLDLGASINVMPKSVYSSLQAGAGTLTSTGVVVQLANRSTAYPEGVLEDVLVKVKDFIFPADFYVLNMEDDRTPGHAPLILGRPFLKTARTIINVHKGTLSMEFAGNTIQFNIIDAMKYPLEDHSALHVNFIDLMVEKACVELYSLESEFPTIHDFTDDMHCPQSHDRLSKCNACSEIDEFLSIVDSAPSHTISDSHVPPIEEVSVVENVVQVGGNISRLVPSIQQPPTLECKPLPENLKYAYLADGDKLPVIIADNLQPDQEEKLLNLLKQHKRAIGWSLADIPGISPSLCMHRIHLEEGAQPKEVSKLLSAGIIYPISDSQWVSPVQVVPKKTGFTVVANERNELVPMRVQNSWRVCIDYRRLNQATRKDHFPLPFIDQMLERLAGKSHYCFLDGFSGYFQICIAPEDQEKTTFTCPFGTFAYRRMPFGLCNAPGTFQRCMVSIFSDLLEHCMEVFMDDFSVYGTSFDECLISLGRVLERCVEKNLVLNFEKCHFMVEQGIVLGHVVSKRGIEVDKSKVDIISSLPYPASVREVRSFLGHAGFYRRFIQDFSKIALPMSNLLQKDVEFKFDESCKMDFEELKRLPSSSDVTTMDCQSIRDDFPDELLYHLHGTEPC
ncbi:uncharacterized protein LOC127788119 [Diospyros lotus]|uniref:uncharacterized protein LOC127788119 n=1 Tax=Diospyros lotus TaxID=55363 RepID=UPI00225BE112|nr:uncharacterized protein LOC127788119 [Diospyros lotus]